MIVNTAQVDPDRREERPGIAILICLLLCSKTVRSIENIVKHIESRTNLVLESS